MKFNLRTAMALRIYHDTYGLLTSEQALDRAVKLDTLIQRRLKEGGFPPGTVFERLRNLTNYAEMLELLMTQDIGDLSRIPMGYGDRMLVLRKALQDQTLQSQT